MFFHKNELFYKFFHDLEGKIKFLKGKIFVTNNEMNMGEITLFCCINKNDCKIFILMSKSMIWSRVGSFCEFWRHLKIRIYHPINKVTIFCTQSGNSNLKSWSYLHNEWSTDSKNKAKFNFYKSLTSTHFGYILKTLVKS